MSRNSSSKAPRDEPGLNPKPKSWGGCDMDGPPSSSSSSSSHAAPPNSGSRGLRDRGNETPGQPGTTGEGPGLLGQLGAGRLREGQGLCGRGRGHPGAGRGPGYLQRPGNPKKPRNAS